MHKHMPLLQNTIFMAATSAGAFSAGIWTSLTCRRDTLKVRPISKSKLTVYASAGRSEKQPPGVGEAGPSVSAVGKNPAPQGEREAEGRRSTLSDYFEQSRELIISCRSDGGPPRWFSPLECGSREENSPLMLYLPGVDGVGLDLTLQHQRLGKFFDIWCMHIPLTDRTPFEGLVKFVESTVRTEYSRAPVRPIYLVGESFGACLALAVAASNQSIDLALILANPATFIEKSLLQPQTLLPLSAVMPEHLPYAITSLCGSLAKMAAAVMRKTLPSDQVTKELSQVISKLVTVEALRWKLDLLKSASEFANSRLHAVKAQTLILARSGQDQLLPSRKESERLGQVLPKCQVRLFEKSSHALFLDDGISMISILIGASFYRRGKQHDYVSDYLPPSPSEFWRVHQPHKWIVDATNPVVLSTLENGDIVRSLAGVPSEGPVIYVGYHMLAASELFSKLKDGKGKLPAISSYDWLRILGAVPVSASNLHKLFSSKAHAVLYPGGLREAGHRKGEEYKLFWPEQSEFVRMAAKFGAKIVPFGVVGEDDVGHLLMDYNDLSRIPFFKNGIAELNQEMVNLRGDFVGEVAKQDMHFPIIVPKVPGRFYFLFGKPIQTQGRKQELKSKEKAQELYMEVKSEVEKCLAYLKEKRESDPYRSILARLGYQATHGFDSEVPTFRLYQPNSTVE